MTLSPRDHYQLGQTLTELRRRNVLVIGSGNIVHNLRVMAWDEQAAPFGWAVEFDERVKEALIANDHRTLIDYERLKESRQAVPTNEHYLPMLYSIAMKEKYEELTFVHESIQNASVSMRCFNF